MCKIIDKIQKLLELANDNPSVAESQSAMLKAQELMLKHKLSEDEVLAKSKQKELNIIEKCVYSSSKLIWYARPLSWVISKNFKIMSFLRVKSQPKQLFFFGEEEDVEIASAIYLDLLEKIKYYIDGFNKENKRLRQKGHHITRDETTCEKNDFIDGFIDGLEEMFKRQVAENNWGLMVVPSEQVKDKFKEKVTGKPIKLKTSALFGGSISYDDGFNKGINYQKTNGYIDKGELI